MNDSAIPEAPSYKGKQPIKQRFGTRLQQIRTDKGYTQMKLAQQSTLDRSFISDLERGVKEPTISSLELIATTFSMTLSELFEGV
jgi:transcriptional regulator with XRE-family HTH domain